jgi:HEAT repeats
MSEPASKVEAPDNPHMVAVLPRSSRIRASGPILLLAILFVLGAFLTWYFTWFGRELSDADISTYLADQNHPRKVQHALLQIQQRIDRKDPNVRQWYPQLIALAHNPETEIRLTVAWLLGFDNQSQEFHDALSQLLRDPEPIVRRNAALALVRFNDPAGRDELRSMLQPYSVRTTAEGIVSSTLRAGSSVSRGALLARVLKPNKEVVGLRSPLEGKIETIAIQSGANISVSDEILTLSSDEESVWEALRGLALIGKKEDIALIQHYLDSNGSLKDRLKQQAALTIKSIQSRKD